MREKGVWAKGRKDCSSWIHELWCLNRTWEYCDLGCRPVLHYYRGRGAAGSLSSVYNDNAVYIQDTMESV